MEPALQEVRVAVAPVEYEEDLPLTVVTHWDEWASRATAVCELIDQHLAYEAKGRILRDMRDFRPQHLCPEQRVQLATDLRVTL